jgi:hypothetical protein
VRTFETPDPIAETTAEASAPTTIGRARFFTGRYEGGATFDRVIARHVLEHTASPLELLRLARGSLKQGGRLFIEVPDLGWIVRNHAFWDLFYEHAGYFSPASLRVAAARAGFAKIRIETSFGGQYLWMEAVAADPAPAPPVPSVLPLEQFAAEVERRRASWAAQLNGWGGRVVLWGAGAKGVTFANLLDPNRQLLHGLVDIHPEKQGRYIPGSAHRVFGPDLLSAGNIDHVLVTNENYLDEIRSCVATSAPTVTLHVL